MSKSLLRRPYLTPHNPLKKAASPFASPASPYQKLLKSFASLLRRLVCVAPPITPIGDARLWERAAP